MAENKLFLDTNIILDFLLARKGELKEIENVFNYASDGIIECYISESVLATCLYFLEKEKRKNIMGMIRNIWPVLKVLPFEHNILYSSIELFSDLEDGLLFFLAQFHKMDFFITRNIKDFKSAPLSLPVVLTPEQFINLYK